jgi:hypothetical protein
MRVRSMVKVVNLSKGEVTLLKEYDMEMDKTKTHAMMMRVSSDVPHVQLLVFDGTC